MKRPAAASSSLLKRPAACSADNAPKRMRKVALETTAANSEALLVGQGAACSAPRALHHAKTPSIKHDFTGAIHPESTPNCEHPLSTAPITSHSLSQQIFIIQGFCVGAQTSVPPVANSCHLDVSVPPVTQVANSTSAALWMPIIADFGNSCTLESTVAFPKHRYCTLQYSAPEVLLRQMPYSYPSDIWSLGAILFEIEHWRAAFPMRGEDDRDPELSQLLQIWKCFTDASCIAQNASPLGIAIKRELQSRLPGCALSKKETERTSLVRPSAGAPFGHSAFLHRCLELEPALRPKSKELIKL